MIQSLLKDHLDNGPRNALYTINYIQNDLILSSCNIIRRQILLNFVEKKFQSSLTKLSAHPVKNTCARLW